jgi:glucose-1-phosphate adenylyltransferase
MQGVLAIILGGGRGARLYPLTKKRSEPAVPIGGNYRLIDIPISNCLNSGIPRIYVVTQYLSVSLHRHIANTYKFDPFSRSYVEVLPARHTNESAGWYEGTADALRQNLGYLQYDDAGEALILSADHLYRMDFADLIRRHRTSGADVTMAVVPVPRRQASRFGVVRLDEQCRIVTLVEKPQADAQLAALRTPPDWLRRQGLPTTEDGEYLANMGIYVFNRQVLLDLLHVQPLAKDLVTEVFARRLSTHPIQAYVFGGYWADVGTIRSYFEASLTLAGNNPPFDFHSPEGIIYTRMRNLPASRVESAVVDSCVVSDGCTIGVGTRLDRCVLGVRSTVGRNVRLREVVVIGADRYETAEERDLNSRRGIPDVGIGDDTIIEQAIVDKDCRIGRGVRIVNVNRLEEDEGENYVIRDGIVVIPNDAVVPDGTVI